MLPNQRQQIYQNVSLERPRVGPDIAATGLDAPTLNWPTVIFGNEGNDRQGNPYFKPAASNGNKTNPTAPPVELELDKTMPQVTDPVGPELKPPAYGARPDASEPLAANVLRRAKVAFPLPTKFGIGT